MDDPSDLLTIKQAAKFLNVSETSLRRWTNDGRLACVRVGKKNIRRFRRKDLLAFLHIQPSVSSARTSADGKNTVIGGVSVQHGTHLCSFYSDDRGRAKLAIDFLADGLHQDCACYLISTPENSREVLNQLQQYRPNYQRDIDQGRLILTEYAETASKQLQMLEDSLRKSLAGGAKAIRLVGNVSDGRLALTNSFDHVLQYEKDLENKLAKRYPLVTLCQYDARKHTGTELMNVLKCHSDVFSYPSDRLLF